MNLTKKQRDAMRQALSVLDGVTFTEDEDEFMAGSGVSGICVDLGRCLDDLVEKGKEIEVLEQNLAAAEETIVHKDNEIEALKAELRKTKVDLGKALGASMTDPKTPQELNEAVAKRLGFDSLKDAECAWYDYNCTGITGLDFTDDPAAAVWALSEWCRKTGTIATSIFPYSNSNPWCFSFGNETPLGSGTFCEAICRAIAGTE